MRRCRTLLAVLALAGTLAAGAAPAGEGAPEPAAPATGTAALPRIVVAFANESRSAPGPAGSTGPRYAGGAYLSQSAEHTARRVASDYGLRQIASWPIRELAMHCVVYEVGGGRAAGEVLAALARDRCTSSTR